MPFRRFRLASRAVPNGARIRRAQFVRKLLPAEVGAYALTGADVELLTGDFLVADSGSYDVAGQEAALVMGRRMAAEQGAFGIIGEEADLVPGKALVAGIGAFDLAGQATGLRRTWILSADAGSFALTGTAATLRKGLEIAAGSGGFALTGQAANLHVARKIAADAGSFALTGQPAGLLRARRLAAAAGSFAVTGQAVTLTHVDIDPTITSAFHGRTPHNSSGATHTFTSEPVGSAASDRIVIVGISWAIAGSANVSSVGIGGNAATIVGETDGTNSGVAFAYAALPVGTTATVSVNFNTSVARCTIAVWSIKNYANAAPYDYAFPSGGGASARTATLDLSAAGVAFAIAFNGSDGDGTFTNASEDFDETGADRTFGARAAGSGAVQTNLGIQHSNCRVIAALSWR